MIVFQTCSFLISGSFSSYLFTHQLDGGPCGEAPGKAALGVAPEKEPDHLLGPGVCC